MKIIAEGTRDWIEYVLTLAPGLSFACFYPQIHSAPVQLAGERLREQSICWNALLISQNTHLEYQCHQVNHCHRYWLFLVFFWKRRPLKTTLIVACRWQLHLSHSQEDFPVLSHHHLDLVLDLRADVGRDVAGQLIGGALEAFHHLLELADHGVARLLLSLLPVLHVILQLLDVCEKKEKKKKHKTSRNQTLEKGEGFSLVWSGFAFDI